MDRKQSFLQAMKRSGIHSITSQPGKLRTGELVNIISVYVNDRGAQLLYDGPENDPTIAEILAWNSSQASWNQKRIRNI